MYPLLQIAAHSYDRAHRLNTYLREVRKMESRFSYQGRPPRRWKREQTQKINCNSSRKYKKEKRERERDYVVRVHQGLSRKSALMSPCLCLSSIVRQPAWPTVPGGSAIIIIYAGSAFGLGPIAHWFTRNLHRCHRWLHHRWICNHFTNHGQIH